MKQMGAKLVEQTEEECMAKVMQQIKAFEEQLSPEQCQFLDSIIKERVISLEDCKFPVLKSVPKVFKYYLIIKMGEVKLT